MVTRQYCSVSERGLSERGREGGGVGGGGGGGESPEG